jgi:hypothetical protein
MAKPFETERRLKALNEFERMLEDFLEQCKRENRSKNEGSSVPARREIGAHCTGPSA